MSMTKEEFMKMAMGAQFSKKEQGLLDAMTMRRAREKVGAQYSENEMNQMNGYGEGSLIGGGATHTMPDGTVMPGAIHGQYENMGSRTGGAITKAETDAFGIPLGASLDVDTMFAKALFNMSPEEAGKIIMTIQNYTPDQQQMFKAQFLQGNVPQYELEAQSNLGF